MHYHIKSLKRAGEGRERIDWVCRDMPVLGLIRKRFAKERPLRGLRVACCLHVTTETANLMRTLKAGGASVVLCASNPLSTQDDTAAALVRFERIPTFAINGEDRKTYYRHLNQVLDHRPHVTLDDGADLVTMLHTKRRGQASAIHASLEETTTGVIRLRSLAQAGKLLFPVIAVNDAQTKHLFDNRYGTGQSTIDGIIRATDVLLAGRTVVVAGYGWCGRGVALRARGMGAHVIVTEVDAIKAIEAVMDGFQVMPMAHATRVGDIFCTLTGNTRIISAQHFRRMKDGAMVCNSGHFDVEIDLVALKKMSRFVKRVRPFVDQYQVKGQKSKIKSIYVLGEGRLINLVAAHGHPASVMDMSFATQALAVEYVAKLRQPLPVGVHTVPERIEQWIANLKLKSMGVTIDRLTPEQKQYLASWQEGT